MTPAEYVAQRTWNTLAHAQALRARLGEETLTDLLMLDMLPHRRVKSSGCGRPRSMPKLKLAQICLSWFAIRPASGHASLCKPRSYIPITITGR